jgi:hypothetical protein
VADALAGGSHPAHSTVNGSPFPPIAEYGFPSGFDLHAGAIAGPDEEARISQ